MADPYIVVLDVAADAVRALLFDSEARRVEGYSAQLPKRADAPEDCLDEMHRLVHAAGFRIAAVVGDAEDRSLWPGFESAAWFPALPEGAGVVIGSGCVSCERFALVIGEKSLLGTVVESQLAELPVGLTCLQIDEKRWLLSGDVTEAGGVYASVRKAIKGSLEEYLENAGADDPQLAQIDLVARRFREVYEALQSRLRGRLPAELAAPHGIALVRSPAWTQRIADVLGVGLTVCTEPEAAGRGAALWALERVGAIEHLRALPASTGAIFIPSHALHY